MKNITLVISVFLFFFSLSDGNAQSKRAERRAAKELAIRTAVVDSIENSRISIDINTIIPSGNMPSKKTQLEYFLKIIDNKLSCYLPYMGVSRTAIIGGSSLSIDANKQDISIQKAYSKEKDFYYLTFTFTSESNNEKWECGLQIFTNGKSNISLKTSSKEPISYFGDLQFDYKVKK